MAKYPVITHCGSTRFKDQFVEAQKRLTLEGNIVISVGLFGHSGDQEVWDSGHQYWSMKWADIVLFQMT